MKRLRILMFCCSLLTCLHIFAQPTGALYDKKEERKTTLRHFFLSGGDDLWYAGIGNQYEQGCYSLGGEIKAYISCYGISLMSASVYVNYRYLFSDPENNVPQKLIGIGAHYSVAGIESDFQFDNNAFVWSVIPKLGYDFGSFSIF